MEKIEFIPSGDQKSCFVFTLVSLPLKNASLIHIFFFLFFYKCTHLKHMDSFKAFLLMFSGFIEQYKAKWCHYNYLCIYLSIYVSIFQSNWQGLVN